MNLLSRIITSRFVRKDDGSTAVEYSVMLALIIISCIGAISGFGGSSGGLWSDSMQTITSEFEASKTGS